MIKYNNNTIYDWYFDTSNLIKVYRNNAVCYYKVISSGDTPTFDVCYAVVDDISQYQETEFEDVFNKSDNSWYKLNNLSQYEEYGLYGSGLTTTYYEGKLTIDNGYEYIYSGGSWVNLGEVSGSTATLPNVPFVLNYNAKDYDANTHTISKTSGQTKEVDAVCTYNTNNVVDHSSDGYISITGNTRFVISGGTTSLIRTNTETGCTMTIVSKVKTSSGYSILTSRGGTTSSQMHWMWRYLTDGIFLHGSSSYNSVTYSVNTTSEPITASVRVNWNNGVQQVINDWTNNGSYSGAFEYGSSSSINNDGSLFCDYLTANMEFWEGDFYWVYMSQSTLTDEQIQQVIAFNESGETKPEYPMYYDDKSDPLNNLTFNTMEAAEEYAYNNCVYDGMIAIINGDRYYFDSTDENGWSPISPPHTPCYDVTTSIFSYTGSMNTVYASDTDKWYKLNNLNEYEEYGLYGSGLSITHYDGKLTIYDGYEYIYSGGSWVNLGEVSGGTRVPQGYTEYDYVSNNSNAYIDTGLLLYSATSNTFKIESTLYSAMVGYQTYQNIFTCMTEAGEPYQGFVYRFESYMLSPRANPSSDVVFSTVDNGDGTSAVTVTCSTGITYTHNYPLVIGCGLDDSKNPFRFTNTSIYSFKLTLNNSLTLDYIPCKRDSDNVYGVYDAVGNTFITSSNSYPFTGGSPSTVVTYPMYYDELQDPPQNLVFYDIREANNYECPYVGLYATIGGVDYLYCETDEWMTLYDHLEVVGEYICEDGNKYKKLQECERNIDGTLQPLSPPIYVKGDLIEEGSSDCQVPYENQYLTFVAETDNVSFTLVGANSSNVFQYSLDNGSTWNNLQIGQTSPSINTNDKILWKASGLTINQEAGIGVIRPSAAARVEGNIMSLCYSDNFSGQTTIPANFQFRKLFSAATYITSSENMVFPATTMASSCYSQMFQGCTAMTVAPKIIGTSAMTWSGDYCWSDMFHGCTSITTAPILPAATLGSATYWCIFEGCTNLSNVTCLATSKQSNSTYGWLSNVASSGTFTKHPNATIWVSGANGIPNGWTVQDYSE